MVLIRRTRCRAKVSDKAAKCPKCGVPVEVQTKKESQFSAQRLVFISFLAVGFIWLVLTGDNVGDSYSHSPQVSQSRVELPTTPQYTIVSAEDLSYATTFRNSYHVRVPREMTEKELIAISSKIILKSKPYRKTKAIVVFYYLPGSDTRGAFTAGKAIWAPGGDWRKAPANLSQRLIVKTGGAKGIVSVENAVLLPRATKEDVYLQFVRNIEGGMCNDLSYAVAAKQYGVTIHDARKICLGGWVKETLEGRSLRLMDGGNSSASQVPSLRDQQILKLMENYPKLFKPAGHNIPGKEWPVTIFRGKKVQEEYLAPGRSYTNECPTHYPILRVPHDPNVEYTIMWTIPDYDAGYE